MFVSGLVVFGILHLIPGDPAAVILGPDAPQADVERLRRHLGLDQPWYVQLLRWFEKLLRGDLGQSLYHEKPVLQAIAERLEPTLLLMALSVLFGMALGIPAGVAAAIRRNRLADRVLMLVALLGISTPSFWLGLNLMLFLAVRAGMFPATGYVPIADEGLGRALYHLLLPALSLGLQQSAGIARITRSSMLDVLRTDYIRTARAKGLAARTVVARHALKNAMIPTLTTVGMAVADLAGGAVVTETVFNLPGAGRLVVTSIMRRDYPVIQGAVLLTAGLYVVINLVVDLLYKLLDPRIEYQ